MDYIYTPRVLQCMHFKHEDNATAPIRIVKDYEFDFSLNCNREMYINGKNFKIEKGCFAVRKPGEKVCSKGLFDCYMLTLDFSNRTVLPNYSRNTATQMQTPFVDDMWKILPSVFKPSHFDDYNRIFSNLLSINEIDINENPKTLPLINELLHLVISDTFSQYYRTDTQNETTIDKVCAYMKKNYMNKITLDDIAAVAHLNKNYLVRQFKKTFGVSPISYLINIRMDYAKKLLVESDLSVKSIAVSCGYNDPSFFNTYFKKTFNVSPEAYRRSQQMI